MISTITFYQQNTHFYNNNKITVKYSQSYLLMVCIQKFTTQLYSSDSCKVQFMGRQVLIERTSLIKNCLFRSLSSAGARYCYGFARIYLPPQLLHGLFLETESAIYYGACYCSGANPILHTSCIQCTITPYLHRCIFTEGK